MALSLWDLQRLVLFAQPVMREKGEDSVDGRREEECEE